MREPKHGAEGHVAELSDREYRFINTYFTKFGFGGTHPIAEINHYMFKHVHWEFEDMIRTLVLKRVLSISPDGLKVRFTDYGMELYSALSREQEAWETGGEVKIFLFEGDEITVGPGEYYKGNRIVRELLARVKKTVDILDAAVSADIFDLVYDTNPRIRMRIITSDRIAKAVSINFDAYAKQFQNVEMKVLPFREGPFSDIVMLLDSARGFTFEHPLNDLGNRGMHIRADRNPQEHLALFEKLWNGL